MPASAVSDFELVKLIGSGHFGFVFLAKENATGTYYAMKQVDKLKYLRNNNVEHLFVERDIMARTTSHWLVKLQYSFYDSSSAYFVMDFLPGGDLMQLLVRNNDCFDEKTARFYLAETCQAINALHSLHYVHRDIKPENLFLDSTGHICLGDFGSAAKLSPSGKVSAKMVVGTPEYVSPEVLMSIEQNAPEDSYGVECDWWSFGVLAFEMVYGCTPFEDDSQMALFNNIMNYHKYFRFPEAETTVDGKAINVSSDMKQLIRNLLTAPDKRFVYPQIRSHAFFAGVNFDRLRSMKPPFLPQLGGPDDTKYFPAQQQKPVLQSSPTKSVQESSRISPDNLPGMRGFNFARTEATQYKVQMPAVVPAAKKERDRSHDVHYANSETETDPEGDLSDFNRDCSNMLRRLVENDRMIAALRDEISQRVSLFEQVQLQRDLLERDLTKQMAENALLTKQVSLQRRELENLERAVRHQLSDVRRQIQVKSAASCSMPATPVHTQTDDSGVIDIDSLLEQLSTLREQVESLTEEKSSLAEQLQRSATVAKERAQQASLQRQTSIRDMEGQTNRLRAAENESRELRRKLDDSRSELASHDRKLNSELASAKAEVTRLETELTDARDRAQSITGLRSRLADAETKVVLLEQRLQRTSAKLEERERQLREKEQAALIAALKPSTPPERKTLQSTVSKRSTAVGTSPSLDNDKQIYKQKFEALEKETDQKISELQKQVTAAERSRDESKAMITRLKKALSDAEVELETARHHSDKIRSDHASVERELRRQLESLNLELALSKQHATEAEKTATAERKSRDNMAKELNGMQQKLKDAELRNITLEKEIAGISDEISRIEVLAGKERKVLSAERERRATVERELAELRSSATVAQKSEASLKSALNGNLEAARRRNDELTAELKSLNSSRVTAEHDLKLAKSRITELEAHIQGLKTSLEQVNEKLANSESLREDLASRIERLREEREALQSHVSHLESAYGVERYRLETTINQQIKLIDFIQSKSKPPQTPSKGTENKAPKSAMKSSSSTSKRHEAVPLSYTTVKFSDSMEMLHTRSVNENYSHDYQVVTPPTSISATNSLLALGPTRSNMG